MAEQQLGTPASGPDDTATKTYVDTALTAYIPPGATPVSVTAAYTAAVGNLVSADATNGGFTVFLPAAPANWEPVWVKKVDSTTNPVTVQAVSGDTFDQAGDTTLVLATPGESGSLQYYSGAWWVVSHSFSVPGLDGRYVRQGASGSPGWYIIQDSNGADAIAIPPATNAVNYWSIYNSSAGSPLYLGVIGADTDISMQIRAKGGGSISLNSGVGEYIGAFYNYPNAVNNLFFANSATTNALTIGAQGTDTDVSINLTPQGAGTVQANGVAVVDVSSTQTLTNKTLTSPSITTPTLTNPVIATIKDSNSNTVMFLSGQSSAVNYVTVQNAATGNYPIVQAAGSDSSIPLMLLGKGSTGSVLVSDAGNSNATIVQFSGGVASPVNYWRFTPSATGNAIPVYALGSDTDVSINLIPKGAGAVQANGVVLDTISAANTLTNKTISGSSNTLSNIGNSSLTNSAITIAGTSTSLGGSITQDTITGLSTTGLIKRTGSNTLAVATAGTDYCSPSSTETMTNKTLTNPKVNQISDTNGNTNLIISPQTSAVNYVTIQNAATGNYPQYGRQAQIPSSHWCF